MLSCVACLHQPGHGQQHFVDRACCSPRCKTVADCSPWRRVPRSSERVLSAPELEGGPLTAQPVPANGLVVSCSPPSWSTTLCRPTRARRSARCAAAADCASWRRVPRSRERVLSAPELRGGPLTAQPVPANGKGRQLLSSIVVSNAPSIEQGRCAPRGAVTWIREKIKFTAGY